LYYRDVANLLIKLFKIGPMSRKKKPEPGRQSTTRRGGVRIIAGCWRGRRIPAPDGTAVRPTPDRVRETLFNWVTPVIEGACCLDLFAGTGGLGIEALSRGATEVWFVERSKAIAANLQEILTTLESQGDRIVIGDATAFLAGSPRPFDLVFLDPPFEGSDLKNLCTLLQDGWLAPGGQIYLEMSSRQTLPSLPEDWTLLREKTAGNVRYALAQKSQNRTETGRE
jgi:16S rRNA (guanine966-N2)-methyltransferase